MSLARPSIARRSALALAIGLGACAGAPEPLPTPEVEAWPRWVPGAWLGTRMEVVDPAQTWRLAVTCTHVRFPADAPPRGRPLLGDAELLTTEPVERLLLTSSALLGPLRLVTAEAFAAEPPAPPAAAATGVLPPDTQLGFAVRWRRIAEPRTAGDLELRIERRGDGEARLIAAAGDGSDDRDVAHLRTPTAAPATIHVLVPFRGDRDGLLVRLQVEAAPTAATATAEALAAHALACEAAGAAIARFAAAATAQPQEDPPAVRAAARLHAQLAATAEPSQARSALRALAQTVGAVLAEDLATVGDQQLIEAVAAAARADAGERPDAETLALLLERAALDQFAARIDAEPLPPVLDAILLRRTGALGRFADPLREAAADAVSLADLDASLLAENRRLLRDHNPVHRVRAFDWLQQKGSAPAGFDPLASPEERRAALVRARRFVPPAPEAPK